MDCRGGGKVGGVDTGGLVRRAVWKGEEGRREVAVAAEIRVVSGEPGGTVLVREDPRGAPSSHRTPTLLSRPQDFSPLRSIDQAARSVPPARGTGEIGRAHV